MSNQNAQIVSLIVDVVFVAYQALKANQELTKDELYKLIDANMEAINANSDRISELVAEIKQQRKGLIVVNGNSAVSPEGFAFIKDKEGTKRNDNGDHIIYMEKDGGVLTGPYGITYIDNETLSDVGLKEGDTMTEDKAIKYLTQGVLMARKAVVQVFNGVEMKQYQFDALVSLAYNIGYGRFTRSESLKRLAKDLSKAADVFNKFVFANGDRIEGLANRRQFEIDLFEKGAYTT